MKSFALGTSTLLFKKFDPVKILPLLAARGVSMEFAREDYPLLETDNAFRKLKKLVNDAGAVVRSIHSPFGMDPSSPEREVRRKTINSVLLCVERAAELGGVAVVLHPGAGPLDNDAVRGECLARARASLAAMQRRMPANCRVKIAVENLPRNGLGRNLAELHVLLDDTDRAKIGYCMDVNHFFYDDHRLKTLREFGSRLAALHISDNDGRDERHWLPGRGAIDWKAWLAALRKTGYSGPMMYEVSGATIAGDKSPRALLDLLINNLNAVFL